MSNSLNVVLLAAWSGCLCLADALDGSTLMAPVFAATYQQGIVAGFVVLAVVGWSAWMFLSRTKNAEPRSAVAQRSTTPSGPSASLFDQLADAHGLSHADADLLRNAVGKEADSSPVEVFVNPELLSRFAETRPDASGDCQRLIERLFGSSVSSTTAGTVS